MKKRVFVTGATGYLGSAVVARLVGAGHDVHGLTRSTDRAKSLEALGVHAVIGDLGESQRWIGVLQNCDSAIHVAFDSGSSAKAGGPATTSQQDFNALEAFRIAALDGRVRKVIYTSGAWVHGHGGGRVVDESAPLAPLEIAKWRAVHEEMALDLSAHDVDVVVMRPGMVYGERRGILGGWFAEAHDAGTVTYPGDGSQHWAAVHRDDVAEAYALALEHGKGGGSYLLTDESHDTVREMAEAVASATRTKARSWSAEDVVRTLGPFGKALLNDLSVTSAKARRELGWVPGHASFVAEVATLRDEWNRGREALAA